ncbi:hypothetical protein HHK36_003205 [Tetracentron sinense]|uniref:F-box domain-containing protein n=1 Tax=Tetracentron sinense TaxID=13715 RepID=A0A835DNQ2_TETSI|nr:hypothetical protein HHK36_003205 [Tetracentron sinense]
MDLNVEGSIWGCRIWVYRSYRLATDTMKRRMVDCIESQMDWGRWENLPKDLLLKIFDGLSDKDLFWTVSSVCRSWQSVCWDILFWKEEILDLRKLRNFLNVKASELYDPLATRLLKLLKSIMDSGDCHGGDGLQDRRTCVTSIVFPPHICLSDRHLVYVAERSPKLKRFELPGMIRITGKGFSRAICNWIEMEQISMGPFYFVHYDRIIQEMGRNCRKLDTLCIYGSMYIFEGKYDPDSLLRKLSRSGNGDCGLLVNLTG